MNSIIRKCRIAVVLFGIILIGAGCSLGTKEDETKIRDLEYTVVGEPEIPEELKEEIESNKNTEFKFTYSDGEYLYIAKGYGEQETNGYSIQMKELYLTENAVYFESELHGPQNGESVSRVLSYPYIVIKTEQVDMPVIFE
jgi:hypothetical protein